jgi:radical SAM protein with 4Fe4S-binding SPASM domain
MQDIRNLCLSRTDIEEIKVFHFSKESLLLNPTNGRVIYLSRPQTKQFERIQKDETSMSQSNINLIRQLFLADLFGSLPEEVFLPRKILLEPVNFCDLSCPVCYRKDRFQRDYMDERWFSEVLEFINLHPEAALTISGGECTLHPDFETFLKKLALLPNRKQVVTNGAVFSDGMLKLCGEANICLTISLDHVDHDLNNQTRDPRAFGRALELLKRATSSHVQTKVNVVVSTFNYEYIGNILSFLRTKGVSIVEFLLYFSLQATHYTPSTDMIRKVMRRLVPLQLEYPELIIENVRSFYHRLDAKPRRYCGAGGRAINILPNRRVRPCPLIDIEDSVPLNRSLQDYFQKPGASFSAFRERSVLDFSECNECDLRFLCGGGCLARNRSTALAAGCNSMLYWNILSEHHTLESIYKGGYK